jgi:hypothetical protein
MGYVPEIGLSTEPALIESNLAFFIQLERRFFRAGT